MPDSIKTARIAFVVAAGLEFATAALLIFIFIVGAGLLGSVLLGAAGIFLAAGFAAFGVADLLIAAGIAKGRPWARYVGFALAVLYLPAIPIGTILGIIVLRGLLGRDARDWFGTVQKGRQAPQVPTTTA
jgi:hypothetical protein